MFRIILLISIVFYCSKTDAQRTIYNPDYISKNFNLEVTKVELTPEETVLHFYVKVPKNRRTAIPKKSYIEDAFGGGQKLYVTKVGGLTNFKGDYVRLPQGEEVRYKLYFPPLPKDVRYINFGESNPGGTWYIYKLNITKNGVNFLNNFRNTKQKHSIKKWHNDIVNTNRSIFKNENVNLEENKRNTLLPNDLPDALFGSWYDKHGTLLLIIRPDYMFLNARVQYYLNIRQFGKGKFQIETTLNFIEILSLNAEILTVRTDRILTLHKQQGLISLPQEVIGNWKHSNTEASIDIKSDKLILKNGQEARALNYKIDYITTSEEGKIIWVFTYLKGNYSVFFIEENNDKYKLYPRGKADRDTYKKQY